MSLAELLDQPAPLGPHPGAQVPQLARPRREQAARHAHPPPAPCCSPGSSTPGGPSRAPAQPCAWPDPEAARLGPARAQPRRPPTLKLRPPEARRNAPRRARATSGEDHRPGEQADQQNQPAEVVEPADGDARRRCRRAASCGSGSRRSARGPRARDRPRRAERDADRDRHRVRADEPDHRACTRPTRTVSSEAGTSPRAPAGARRARRGARGRLAARLLRRGARGSCGAWCSPGGPAPALAPLRPGHSVRDAAGRGAPA